MPEGLDVIIIDDDPDVCEVLTEIVKRFYTWGDVISFSDLDARPAWQFLSWISSWAGKAASSSWI